MIRSIFTILAITCQIGAACELRVEVGGVGCHTRQLAVQKIWSSLPGVFSVTIQPKGPDDPANRRVFIVKSETDLDPSTLETALGARTRFYRILSVKRTDFTNPTLSKSAAPAKVRP